MNVQDNAIRWRYEIDGYEMYAIRCMCYEMFAMRCIIKLIGSGDLEGAKTCLSKIDRKYSLTFTEINKIQCSLGDTKSRLQFSRRNAYAGTLTNSANTVSTLANIVQFSKHLKKGDYIAEWAIFGFFGLLTLSNAAAILLTNQKIEEVQAIIDLLEKKTEELYELNVELSTVQDQITKKKAEPEIYFENSIETTTS
jgi:hypothetical protein